MLTENRINFLYWAINTINIIKTHFTKKIGISPTPLLGELFDFPTYQIYKIVLEIDTSMFKYIKSSEINDFNIVAAYHINSNNKLIKNEVYTIERIIKTKSKLDKINYNFNEHAQNTLFICKLKNQNKAFIIKRIFWSHIRKIYAEYLNNKFDILINIYNSFKTLMLNNNTNLFNNKYLLTTYSDKNILTKIVLKAKYDKRFKDEIIYKYILFKEYENARIRRSKPKIFKIFKKEHEIIDKNILPNKDYKETTLFKEKYLSNVEDIHQTVLLFDLLTASKLL